MLKQNKVRFGARLNDEPPGNEPQQRIKPHFVYNKTIDLLIIPPTIKL